MFLTFNEQASRYSVKSLTSKLAAAVMNLQRSARPSGPHHFIHNSAARARVKCGKGNFTTVPVLMNSSDVRSELELLVVPPGWLTTEQREDYSSVSLCLAHVMIQMHLRHDRMRNTEQMVHQKSG